jgi:EAL domain-containing protein (putative c-di-GMP-specific phosphodiesterase class I)
MPMVDRWVISRTVETLAYRGDPDSDPYMLSINLSGTTLNDARFLDFLLGELTAAAIPPGALCFEITETAAVTSLANARFLMSELKQRGCKFALDDFGTGVSSFVYLKTPGRLREDRRHFVRNVTRCGRRVS